MLNIRAKFSRTCSFREYNEDHERTNNEPTNMHDYHTSSHDGGQKSQGNLADGPQLEARTFCKRDWTPTGHFAQM